MSKRPDEVATKNQAKGGSELPPGAAAAPSAASRTLGAYHVEALDRVGKAGAGAGGGSPRNGSARGAAQESARSRKAQRAELEAERTRSGLGDTSLLRKLWPFLEPQRAWLTVAVASSLVTSGISLLRPLIMLWAIDRSVATKDETLILLGGLAFAAAAIVEQLLGFIQTYATQIVGARAMADLRLHVFRFIGRLPQAFFDHQPVGRLVTRVTNDVDSIQELFNSGIVSVLGSVLRLVGVVVLMLLLDVKLSLVAFAALPVIGLVVMWVRKRARDAFRAIRGETARMNSNMNEQVTGLAVVQAFGQERAMFAQFEEINASYRDANVSAIKFEAIQDAAVDAIGAIAMAMIIVALGYHHASFGTVVALSAYLGLFFEPITALAQLYTLVQNALSGAERVFGLLNEPGRDMARPTESGPDGTSVAQPLESADRSLAIEFRNVSFGYKQDLPVLHDVSFAAKPGQVVALVGPTGSGKTTVTALLLRLYEAWSGRISVNGDDVLGLSAAELRGRFSVVPQEVLLFPGTLAENVALGSVPDLERVRSVLVQMGVLDLFEKREGGLSARVHTSGSNFSAGERQLIAFARALYRDAHILILDEATASVDSDTEARMQKALAVLMAGRTSIVVAHRLSTIRAAHVIIVLSRGHIVESGTHEELIKAGGLYAALYDLQMARAS